MKNNIKYRTKLGALVSIALLVLTVEFSTIPPANAHNSEKADSLYIGDQTDPSASDSTVKRFDAKTGEFLGAFVTSNSGGLHGPRGLIFDHPTKTSKNQRRKDRFLAVNQNAI